MGATRHEPLNLAECRRLIVGETSIDDATLLAVRDQLYALARVVLMAHASTAEAFGALSEADRLDVEERAAILEFEAKMPRRHAERVALTRRARHRPQ